MIFLARLRNAIFRMRIRRASVASGQSCRVLGFDCGLKSKPRGRALFIYSPSALERHRAGAQWRHFNPDGAVVEIAMALNEAGLVVDAIGIHDTDFVPQHEYSLLVAHAGPAYCKYGEMLRCPVLDYSTGCHWREFNRQTESRYADFARRHGLGDVPPPMRPLVVEHEDYAAARADLVVCLGAPTARTFEPFAKRVAHVNNSAAVNAPPPPAVTEARRRAFLYTGGTGNVQKGLDLLIEAFAAEPGLHLHIDAPLEPELLSACGRELRSPNIHYVEWERKLPNGTNRIARRCAFTIYAGLNSGQSTTVVASLAYGLIPVITRETSFGLDGIEVAIETACVADIRTAIRAAAGLPTSEISSRAQRVAAAFREDFSPAAYRGGFMRAIESLVT